MDKRAKEVLWITGLFTIEFALISLTYLLHNVFYSTFNLYTGVLIFLIVFGIFYPIYLEFTIFDTILSILTTTSYTFLWVFSVEAGFGVYYDLINITIGAILVLLIWIIHDRLVPLKGIWNKKIITEKIRIIGAPFFFLILAGLWAFVMAVALLFNFSFILFILVVAVLIYLVFFALYYFDVAKKYVEKEKGENHGKPKPKR